jgi:hypothetical protein
MQQIVLKTVFKIAYTGNTVKKMNPVPVKKSGKLMFKLMSHALEIRALFHQDLNRRN